MRLIKVRWFSMIAASVLFAGGVLGACSDDAGTSLTKLEVSPPTATLAVATTQQLEATGIYSDGTSKNVSTTVTWASSDDAVATVSAAGLVEAKQDGTATIKATLLGIEATATITVSTATLSTIEVTPTDPSIAVATTQQFTATGVFSDQSTQDLTNQVAWTSADTKVAEITSAGLATGNAAGKSTITATLSGTSGTTVLTVSAATLTTIEVTPVAPTLAVGAQEQFKATGVFSDKTTQDITTQVTWASSDAAIATISDAAADKGLAKALAKGTTTITATLSGTVGKTDLTVTDATLTSIDVTPAAPSIAKGSTQQFTATATYSDKSTQDITTQVTWASSDAAVATVSNATADMGLATALKKGTTTIKASLSGVDGTTTLTVTDATLTAIEVTPTTPSIAKSSTQQFIATGTYSDQSTQDITAQVTWSSSDVTVAMISNATADMGLATALAKGTTTIKASLSGVDGSTTLTVTEVTLSSIAVTPATSSIAKGTTQQFTAMATYSDSSTQDVSSQVTWSSSDAAVAAVSNAVEDKGLATALTTGTATIKASLLGIEGTATLTVTAATLTSIAVTPTAPSIAKGTTQTFVATATYSDQSNQNVTTQVTWASSYAGVATVSNAAGSEGLASAFASGTTTITATLGGQSGTAELTVTAATVTAIAVTPATPTIAKGSKQHFIATATYSDQTNQNVTTQVSWSSSATSVATMSNAAGSEGLATALSQGTATITATLAGQHGTADLTVTAATVSSIAVAPATPAIADGTTQQFFATATYTDSTTQNVTLAVTWSSSATNVATVSNANGSQGLASAASPGTTTITATLGTQNGSTTLTVTSATLSSIALTPSSLELPVGATQQFTATGTFSDSTTQDITVLATWTSSTPSAATVSSAAGSKGLATAVSPGSTTVEASFMGKTGTTVLAVTPATLKTIAVTPPSPTTAKGTTVQFTATGTYTDSSTRDLTTSVTWKSSATAVASVSNAAGSEGLASGSNQGTTTISAVLSGVTGSTSLVVTAAILTGVAVTPVNPSIAKGTTQQFTATGTYSDNSTQDITDQVTWDTSDHAIATISNAAGSRGLASGIDQGGTTVTATLGTEHGTASLTVAAAILSSLAVTPSSVILAKGTTQQFTATGTFSDNSTQDLTSAAAWSSDDLTTVTISNAAGSEGLATAVAQGSANVTASYAGKTNSASVTVTPASLKSITVTPTNPSIAKGTTQEFLATGIFSDNSNQDITNQVTWTSSDTGVATISNAAGTAGTATSGSIGTTTISATLSGKTGSTDLEVTAATLQSITITPVNPSIAKGTTQQFAAMGTYSDSTTQDITTQVTWRSSKRQVASISNASGTEGLATARAEGISIITATLGTESGSTLLTVSAAKLTGLAITPQNPSIAKGTEQQFVATGTYSDSSTQNLTGAVTWSSSNTDVATISNVSGSHGMATGGGQGQTIIAATIQGQSDNTTLTVTAATLQSITVTPAGASLVVGGTQQYLATGTYSDLTHQDITTQVTWSMVDTAVASISNAASSEGLATGVALGTTTVDAKMSGVTGSTGVTVTIVP